MGRLLRYAHNWLQALRVSPSEFGWLRLFRGSRVLRLWLTCFRLGFGLQACDSFAFLLVGGSVAQAHATWSASSA